MASDYGRNFGFRRSDESSAVREGRFKTPVGSAFLQGSAVEIDPASPGYLKQSADAVTPETGYHGLLVQEDAHLGSVYAMDVANHDSFSLGVCKPNKLSVIWSGPSKVWLKNTASQTRADGRSISAVTIVVTTSLAVGDLLKWDGSKWVETATRAEAWMKVTAVSSGYAEATLLF